MVLTKSRALEQSQRVRIEIDPHTYGKRVKIRVENHDPTLGWYTSGSLAFPLPQLPLLEQAVEEMRACECRDEISPDNIIPFPGC